jgi:hypothetical protein
MSQDSEETVGVLWRLAAQGKSLMNTVMRGIERCSRQTFIKWMSQDQWTPAQACPVEMLWLQYCSTLVCQNTLYSLSKTSFFYPLFGLSGSHVPHPTSHIWNPISLFFSYTGPFYKSTHNFSALCTCSCSTTSSLETSFSLIFSEAY